MYIYSWLLPQVDNFGLIYQFFLKPVIACIYSLALNFAQTPFWIVDPGTLTSVIWVSQL